MNKTVIISKHELINTFKRTSFILTTISIPLIMLVGWVVFQGIQRWSSSGIPEVSRIGYVDNAGIIEGYAEQGKYSFIKYDNVESAKNALISKEVDEYFVIPPDYIASGTIIQYSAGKGVDISGGADARTGIIERFLNSNIIDESIGDQARERVLSPMVMNKIRLDKTGEPISQQNPFVVIFFPYIFGLLFIFSVFFTSGYLLQGISEEKENRVVEILLSSVSAGQLLAGKILGLGAAGLCQILIWLISIKLFSYILSVNIPALSGLHIPYGLILFSLIYFILGYFLYASLFAVVGSVGTTARESQQLSSIFIVPALIPIWIAMVILTKPESAVAIVLSLFPFTAPVTAMILLPSGAMNIWQIILSLVILIASIIFCMWFGSRIFRASILMYGKRPGLAQIIKSFS